MLQSWSMVIICCQLCIKSDSSAVYYKRVTVRILGVNSPYLFAVIKVCRLFTTIQNYPLNNLTQHFDQMQNNNETVTGHLS